MISTFNNRPISDMTRDDLIGALDLVVGLLNAARRARDYDREMQQFAVGLVSSHTDAYRARPVMRQVERAS